jgi:hypothetical protein
MRNILVVLGCAVIGGCGGSSGYSGLLLNGMDGSGMEGIRVVARSSPPSPDLTCRVREVKTGAGGAFSFADFCRGQPYVLSVPAANLHLSGSNTAESAEQTEPGKHLAWTAPDGQGIYRLSDGKVQPMPTFSDVATDETIDGTPIVYPTMKPTGRVITISEGEHLVISGKKWVKGQQIRPLVAESGRHRLASGFITDHVFVGVKLKGTGLERVEATVDKSKTTEVLIRGEGVRFVAHDAVTAGRYALMADGDSRVTIVDFGESQAPQK